MSPATCLGLHLTHAMVDTSGPSLFAERNGLVLRWDTVNDDAWLRTQLGRVALPCGNGKLRDMDCGKRHVTFLLPASTWASHPSSWRVPVLFCRVPVRSSAVRSPQCKKPPLAHLELWAMRLRNIQERTPRLIVHRAPVSAAAGLRRSPGPLADGGIRSPTGCEMPPENRAKPGRAPPHETHPIAALDLLHGARGLAGRSGSPASVRALLPSPQLKQTAVALRLQPVDPFAARDRSRPPFAS